MTTTDAPTGGKQKGGLPAPIADFRQMAAAIPAGGDDTGLLNILAQLAAAASPEELAAPWETTGTEKLLGHVLVVTDLKRMPSDFEAGLGFYLVVTATDTETGELSTFTTGAVSIVAQLTKAYAMGWLPMKCEIVEAERATAAGHYPQHLRVYGRGGDF